MSYNLFLSIDGIDGESNVKGHEGDIELLSFSWGLTQTSPSGSGNSFGRNPPHGRPKLTDLSVTKVADKASPKLFAACATGKHFAKVVLTSRQGGDATNNNDFIKYTFNDVLISGFIAGGHANSATEDRPLDQISLNFSKIELDYLPTSDTGSSGPAGGV